MGKLMLEGSYYPATSDPNKVLALLDDLRWHNVIVMKGRYLDLYSFNAIAADKANLSVTIALECWSAKL